jgi:hypothetical protein
LITTYKKEAINDTTRENNNNNNNNNTYQLNKSKRQRTTSSYNIMTKTNDNQDDDDDDNKNIEIAEQLLNELVPETLIVPADVALGKSRESDGHHDHDEINSKKEIKAIHDEQK